jgi:hypothetical protein
MGRRQRSTSLGPARPRAAPVDDEVTRLLARVQAALTVVRARTKPDRATWLAAVHEVGSFLLNVQASMPYGAWTAWLHEAWPQSPRTARLYMKLARDLEDQPAVAAPTVRALAAEFPTLRLRKGKRGGAFVLPPSPLESGNVANVEGVVPNRETTKGD